MVAHLVVSGIALITTSASSDKRNCHPISNLEILYLISGFYNFTGQLMPGNMWKYNVCIMPLPTVPIAQAHARGFDFDNNPMALGRRGRHILKLQGTSELFVYDCFHLFAFRLSFYIDRRITDIDPASTNLFHQNELTAELAFGIIDRILSLSEDNRH